MITETAASLLEIRAKVRFSLQCEKPVIHSSNQAISLASTSSITTQPRSAGEEEQRNDWSSGVDALRNQSPQSPGSVSYHRPATAGAIIIIAHVAQV